MCIPSKSNSFNESLECVKHFHSRNHCQKTFLKWKCDYLRNVNKLVSIARSV